MQAKTIIFNLLKIAYPRNNDVNKDVSRSELMILINNVLDNMNTLLQYYEKLTEEQKDEVVRRAKINDNSLSTYLLHNIINQSI